MTLMCSATLQYFKGGVFTFLLHEKGSFLMGDNEGVEQALVLSSHIDSGDEHCFFFCCDAL